MNAHLLINALQFTGHCYVLSLLLESKIKQSALKEITIRAFNVTICSQYVIIAGSVDTVVERLSYYTDVLHAGMLVTGGHLGETPGYLVLKTQEMMAKEVMPHFREKAAATPDDQPLRVAY